ncbi:MAG TPA: DUF2231 domain-containing protein [Burkholderiales bacterium]|nr:DUF2231 domain-containing protein [Burkholderiales bacterium]
MRTPARIAKHPIHPMIVPIPIGLWLFSLACDLVHRFGGSSPNWEIVAYYAMVGGIVGALIAAIPGLVDVFSLPDSVKPIGFSHMGLNLAIVVLYLVNAWMRRDGVTDGLIWLSVISVLLLGVSGWLGGEMVYARGVAVEPGAALATESESNFARARYTGPERRSAVVKERYFGPERRMATQ